MRAQFRHRWRSSFFGLLLALFTLLGSTSLAGQVGQTMRGLMQQAVEAFQADRYEEAARLFHQLEATFGREPEFRAPRTQRMLLPLNGYAHLLSGDPQRAVALFREALQIVEMSSADRVFVRYALAQALEAAGEYDAAIDAFGRFAEQHPAEPGAALALLRQAELRLETGDLESGVSLLNAFYAGGHPPSLRTQARLRAIRALTDAKEWESSAALLFGTDWSLRTMPELGVLAFAALRIGDRFLASERPIAALRAYRLVPPRNELIERQEERLHAVRTHYARYRAHLTPSSASIWENYFLRITGRIESTLEGLRGSEDYTPGFQLRRGHAFLLAGRPREAIQILRYLAGDTTLAERDRREAHYRWIVAAISMERWDDALAIGRAYLREYSDSERVPQTLFLLARTYREQRDLESAAAILRELLEEYPDHGQAERWLFTLGFVALEQEAQADARRHFARIAADRNANGSNLVDPARFWHAMAWFLEQSYDRALQEFHALRGTLPAQHRLEPEIHYRVAATRYAMRDYDEALREIDGFLQRFPGHAREPEGRVLRGDILMGQGRHIEAASDFRRVPPEHSALFVYAIFQSGKIYRALEEYDLMVHHFQSYLERDDLLKRPRVSEALYWIGWARQQQGRVSEAVPLFLSALDRYGNDPAATEIDAILDALEYQVQRNPELGATLGGITEFESWLETARADALRNSQFTWFARLSLRLGKTQPRDGTHDEGKGYLREIADLVPVDRLDAFALGRMGAFFYLRGEAAEAERYLHRLLESFPDSPDRAHALHYLGRLAEDRGEWQSARHLFHRIISELPMHPLGPESMLAHGRVLTALGAYDAAREQFEALLRLRQARGRPQAEALQGLARIAEAREEPKRAIPYYQRIYNMYRAFPDLTADAYRRSAAMFEATGDLQAAYNTWRELRFMNETDDPSLHEEAKREMRRLEVLLPRDATVDSPISSDGDNEHG